MAYPIKPADIDSTKNFFDAFGDMTKEVSARCLVRFAQQNGDWRDFTKAEIDAFEGHDVSFNGLDRASGYDPPMIVPRENGSFGFTHEFIARCFLSSPATKQVTE